MTAQEAVGVGYEVQKETAVIQCQKEVDCIVLEVALDTSRATRGNVLKVHKSHAFSNVKCSTETTSRSRICRRYDRNEREKKLALEESQSKRLAP